MAVRIRMRSQIRILGMPLWCVATGGNPRKGETFGHAKGFFALGDVATGVFALGGISTGVVAVGGVSFGVFTLGGVALGALFALGGVALAVVGFAMGGVAVGLAAYGGVAVGVWGKGAVGAWVYDIWVEVSSCPVTATLARWLPWCG